MKKIVTTTILCFSLFFSCSDVGGETNLPPVTATIIPKGANDIRDSYGVFKISAIKNHTNYRLAVAQSMPSALDMSNYGIKRNLSPDAINVLIAHPLSSDNKLLTLASGFFGGTIFLTQGTNTGLTTGMETTFLDDSKKMAMVYDKTATGADRWVMESVLKPSTSYTLYGMEDGGSAITSLATFSTDDRTERTPTPNTNYQFTDTSLSNITLTVNRNENTIIPLHFDINTNTFRFYSYSISSAIANIILNGNLQVAGGAIPPEYTNLIYSLGNIGSSTTEDLVKSFVVLNPSRIPPASLSATVTYGGGGLTSSRLLITLQPQ